MEIQSYIEIVRRRIWVIILTFLVTLSVVAFGSWRMTPVYSASSLVRVAQPQVGTINWNDLNYATRLLETYTQLLKSRPFLDEVIRRLSLSIDPTSLGDAVKVVAIADTELLRITAESTDPSQAAAIANTLAALLVEQGQQMYSGQSKSARAILEEQVALLEHQLAQDRAEYALAVGAEPEATATAAGRKENLAAKIRAEEQSYVLLLGEYDNARVTEALRTNSVSIVEPAEVPARPSRPKPKLYLALGAMVGLLGGLGLALFVDRLDPTIHAVDDLARRLGVRFLARIPELPRQRGTGSENPALVYNSPGSGAEAFMTLAASISSLDSGAMPRSLVVTSAEPGVGKSTVTVNLAALLALSGREVIVVDGDLRRPCVHRALGLARAPGLSDVMLDRDRLDAALQQTWIPGLRALAAGSPQVNPGGLWQSGGFSELAARLASEAEIVLWDAPPVLAVADTLFLAPAASGVLFVVARDQSRIKQVELALAQLRQVGSQPLGVVYNRATKEDWGYYDYYHRKSQPEPDRWNPAREDQGRLDYGCRKFPRLLETFDLSRQDGGSHDSDRRKASSDTRQPARVHASVSVERSVDAFAEQ